MDDQNTTYSLNDYYKLPDGRYISYYELANNPKYSTRKEETWYSVPISYVLNNFDKNNWRYNGKLLSKKQFKQRFGKDKTVLTKEKPTGVAIKPVLHYIWTDSNGKSYSGNISNLLEKQYLNKLNGIQSTIPAFYTDEGVPLQLGEVVVTAKLTDEGKRKAEERLQLQLEQERAAEELAHQNWLNNPKGLCNFNLPATTNYISQQVLRDTGSNFVDRYFTGSANSLNFLKNLHSSEMRKWDYFGLSLLAPNLMFALPSLAAGASYFAPGTIGGNILGHTAGSMAIGTALDEGLRYLFGQSAGDWLTNKAVNDWGVNQTVADMLLRPEYWFNPTGKITGNLTKLLFPGVDDPYKALTHVGVDNSIPISGIHYPPANPNAITKGVNLFRLGLAMDNALNGPRFQNGGIRLGDNVYTLGVNNGKLYSGIPAPKINKTPITPLWQLEHLPGYQLKILMEGSPLEKSISKNGIINVNVLKSLLNTTSKANRDIIENVINTKFAGQKNIDYNDLRKAVLEELVNFNTSSTNKYRSYGLDKLGYRVGPDPEKKFSGISPDVDALVIVFSSPKITNGSNVHFSENTLGHTRYYTHPDEPDVLYIMESLSDWAQRSKNSSAKSIDNDIKILNEILKQGDDGFITSNVINDRIAQLTLEKANLPIRIYTPHEKYLVDNNLRWLLQENLKLAASNGKTKMRYPTPETAAKILYYPKDYDILPGQDDAIKATQIMQMKVKLLKSVRPKLHRNRVHPSKKFIEDFGWTNLKLSEDGKKIITTDKPSPYNLTTEEIMWDPEIKKLVEKLPDLEVPASLIAQMEYYNKYYPLWKKQRDMTKAAESAAQKNIKRATNESDMMYKPQHQTILRKYADFSKTYQSIVKNGEVRTITDPKGNTWYEVDIPENLLDMELLYNKGGKLIKRFK